MRQEMMGVLECSGISWTICKQSAPRSRQITTPTPHRSLFTGRMLFLTPNQQCQGTEGIEDKNVQIYDKTEKNSYHYAKVTKVGSVHSF